MPTDNFAIADQFSLLSKLMDIHGENSFKTKSYSIAAFHIEKLPEQLALLPKDKIFGIKGIGEAIGKKIIEILETGELRVLKELIEKTPPGIIEMLNIKGLGPKKIAIVWKEMEIESIGELLYACNENRLLLFKGFGEKTQRNIKETIEFYMHHQGNHLYAETESFAVEMEKQISSHLPMFRFEITGEFRRQLEIIIQLEWVTTAPADHLEAFFSPHGYTTSYNEPTKIIFKGPENIPLCFHCCSDEEFANTLFRSSAGEAFLKAWDGLAGAATHQPAATEAELFSSRGLRFLPAYIREKAEILQTAARQDIPEPVELSSVKGIIHSHSNWSDGIHTLEQMALAAREQGFEYLVISDHSKSAFYANGLSEERIHEQHRSIDELNKKLAPFIIFKSIESDILNDGNLDYPDAVLASFDLVIASVHSNLKMTEEKAMARLLRAIENPFTTILGHPTGRLLLSRPGYPVNHERLIDACAANQVIIELNAHPRRLDIDWRWIDHAIKKNVLISIDPDAHSIEGFHDIRYGVLSAQKAGLTASGNFSSFSREQVQEYISKRRK